MNSSSSGVKRQRYFTSDDDSELESSSQTQNVFPAFIVIQATNKEKPIIKQSPFAIQKQIQSISGTVKGIKNLRNGTLLVECRTKQQTENLLKTTHFLGQKVKTFAHQTLNFSKGIVRCREISDVPMEDVKKEMLKEGVTDVKRISIKRNGQEIVTNTYIFTFNTPKIPEKVLVAYILRNVEVYVPNPLRCFKCQEYGHHEDGCKAQVAVCGRCADAGHSFKDCRADEQKCVNCKQDHLAGSRACSIWKREKEILRIKYSEGVSFYQARSIYEQRNKIIEQSQSNLSYANKTKETSPERDLCKMLVNQLCQLLPEQETQIRQILQSLKDGPVTASPAPSTTLASKTPDQTNTQKKSNQKTKKNQKPEQKSPTKVNNEPKKKIQLQTHSICKQPSTDTITKDKKGKIRRCVVGESNEVAPNPIPTDSNPFEVLEDMEDDGVLPERHKSPPDSWMDRADAVE